MKTSINEITLLEQKDVREQMMERLEVLDKIKKLFLIPELEVMTIKQVAEYYDIAYDTLKKCYKRHKDEIDTDGVSIKSYHKFLKGHDVPLKTSQGKITVKVTDEITLEIPSRGIKVFSKRAILRIGMLLRDSKVAQEVRTQLLNTYEHSTKQQRTQEIDNEQKILVDIATAFTNGDIDEFAKASMIYNAYQKRYIHQLENDNKALTGEILKWDERHSMNKAIRLFSTKANKPFGTAWNLFYDELRYKHGIALTSRGGKPYIKHIKKDEWSLAIQSLSALCESYGVSPSQIMEKAKLS